MMASQSLQRWMQEAISLSSSLQGIPPSYKLNVSLFIEKWVGEQKETGVTALLTQLSQSILSSTEIKTGRNFCLERNAQHSKHSNTQISNAPETRSSPGGKWVKAEVVQGVDKPLDEKALTEASGNMPEVRLVIQSPYIDRPKFKGMFGVIQDAVDFTVKLDLQFDAYTKPFGFCCDIIYDPASNDCHLYNRSGSSIYLISSEDPPTEQEINYERQEPMCSGAWRISIKPDETTGYLYPIFDILVRERNFSISADNDTKAATVLGTNLFPRDPQEVQYTPTTSLRRIRTSILGLADGETARIKDWCDDKRTYDLQRLTKIAGSYKTSVFSCRHSRLPDMELVAKPNIVSLKEADPRIFAIYLERLPLSLDKNCGLGSSWADAKIVLFDIASALTYLTKQNIIHYDVKPQNIAFSHERGAILFDFDLGDYVKPIYSSPGGTFRFLPPETIEPGNTRGLPGDVWALGVTILWIVNMENSTNLWDPMININDLHRPESYTYNEIVKRLRFIALQRSLLNLGDKVQALVYEMLEPKTEARVTAAIIHGKDDRKPQDGRSAKKRKRG
ncbi:kinase-like domain-containing protein [Trichoderma barbatum]